MECRHPVSFVLKEPQEALGGSVGDLSMPVFGNSAFGFPLGWDYRRPDQPDFGGPVRNLQTGNFEQTRAPSVEDEWGQWCGEKPGGGCAAAVRQVRASDVNGPESDSGDYGHAIARAAAAPNVAARWAPPEFVVAEQCYSLGSELRLNLASGNLLTQLRPPAGDEFDPVPVLTYNAQSTEATEYGFGWYGTYGRRVNEGMMDVEAGSRHSIPCTSLRNVEDHRSQGSSRDCYNTARLPYADFNGHHCHRGYNCRLGVLASAL